MLTEVNPTRDAIMRHFQLGEVFSTADLIRAIDGAFVSNAGVSASQAPNALFGKLLSKNADTLGIVNVAKGRRVQDDNGRRTQTATWRRVR